MNAETSLLALGGHEIEYLHVRASRAKTDSPPIVFLHEGLGSIELWRDFPFELRRKLDDPELLIYSRAGYGRSTPVATKRSLRYMHDEATTTLPALLDALGIKNPILIGHSDGASIALIYAGLGYPVRAMVLIAPHVMVEKESIAGIRGAREAFLSTDLPSRLAKYHRDAEATFWAWNNAWLSPEFLHWNIEKYLPEIAAPILCIQGDLDEFATVNQLESIASGVSGEIEIELIKGARHSPHLENTGDVVARIGSFFARHISEGNKA